MNFPAPVFASESRRLSSLRSFAILDTPADPSFDRMAGLAAKLLEAPISAVSLVDEDRQWFKARCGLDVPETPRSIAFCAHALGGRDPLIVEDAMRDRRFRDNPLVLGEPGIRAYVGVPLIASDGYALGTLCVIYREPKTVTPEQIAILEDLAASTTDLLEAHRLRISAARETKVLQRLRTELNMQLDLMSSMSEATMTGGWSVDVASGDLVWTDQTFRIHGLEPGRQPDVETAIEAYVEEDRDVIVEHVRRCMKDGTPFSAELRLRLPDGSEKWVRSIGHARAGEDGQIEKIYGACQDITEEREHRDELITQRREAEAANRAKDDFLAAMSHEIRTPMNGILGMLELIQMGDLCPLQRERVRVAYQSGEALLGLLNDIIDYAKIKAGSVELASEAIELRTVISTASGLLAPSAHDKGLSLEVKVADDLPDFVLGDALRVRQVITNFLSNAIKFTDEGAITVEASLVPSPDGPSVRIAITDTGMGISEAQQALLFQRFSQVDMSLSRRHAGAGLGLAISRELTHAMGGDIGVESEEGRGSTFWFSFPLKGADGASARGGNHEPNTEIPPLRILLVEDNPVNQMVIEAMCRAGGHQVTTTADGLEAIEVFEPGRFDVILMDMQMPRMDGTEAARTIRARWPEDRTPIVALTANALNSHRDLCIEAGMDHFLSKPVKGATLADALGEVCGKA